MNAGFASLTVLKAHLLAEALREGTEYDTQLKAIGLGVVTAFEKACNRLFWRTASDTYECSGDRDHVFLPRYPVESVASIALKVDQTVGYETQTNLILNRNDSAGWVYWGSSFGFESVIKLTYTGGYWWDTSEDSSGTIPALANALPDDLFLAWLMQCEHLWKRKDRLGLSVAVAPDRAVAIPADELTPQVRSIIAGRIRYAIT